MKERPKIVCLCGSTRFYAAFQLLNYQETMAGKIVLSAGFYPHGPKDGHGESNACTPEEKEALDKLHKRKIDLADDILVINVRSYIGDSTRSEVAYAIEHKKPVRWLEKPDKTPLPDAVGVRTKSPIGMGRCGRCGHSGVALLAPGDPAIGSISVCPQCGHRQEFLGLFCTMSNLAGWNWGGLPDEAKPAQEPDWSTHQLCCIENTGCRNCGAHRPIGGGYTKDKPPRVGWSARCQECRHWMVFCGYYDGGEKRGWLWKDGGPAVLEPITTTQVTELVERWAVADSRFGCPACRVSWTWDHTVPVEKHLRHQCPQCGRWSEYLGLGGAAGDPRWIWRTVPTKAPKVVDTGYEPTEKRPALYYTVRSAVTAVVRATRGHDSLVMGTHRPDWRHFALWDSAARWIADTHSKQVGSMTAEQPYVIVKHVAKRKAGA